MPAVRQSHLVAEVLRSNAGQAFVTQTCVEALTTYTTPSPTTPTGAGVSQSVAEVLILLTDTRARVSQACVEVLFSAATIGEGGAVGGPFPFLPPLPSARPSRSSHSPCSGRSCPRCLREFADRWASACRSGG